MIMTEKEAIKFLKKHSNSEDAFGKVLRHSKTVRGLALKIAKGTKADLKLIKTGSLLHDIGRFKYPPWKKGIRHGIEGERILKKENLPKHARIAAFHIGSGITKKEAQKLGLPAKDCMPKTIEEKIVCYADSLVFFDKIKNHKAVEERYRTEVGEELVKRTKKLRNELRRISPYMKKHPEL